MHAMSTEVHLLDRQIEVMDIRLGHFESSTEPDDPFQRTARASSTEPGRGHGPWGGRVKDMSFQAACSKKAS